MDTTKCDHPQKEHNKPPGLEMEVQLPQTQGQSSGCGNGSAGGCTIRSWSFSNMYASKKIVAQGMMDIALLTANANQLRQLLEYELKSTTFYTVLTLILISMSLQVAVGVILIFKGRYNLRREKQKRAIRFNNYVVVCVFLITVTNIFIAAFSLNGLASVSKSNQSSI